MVYILASDPDPPSPVVAEGPRMTISTVVEKLLKLYKPLLELNHLNFSYGIAPGTANLELDGGINDLQEKIISFFDKNIRFSSGGDVLLSLSHCRVNRHTVTLELLLKNSNAQPAQEFKLSVPLESSDTQAATETKSRAKNIFVYEDDVLSRLLIDFLLKKNGVRTETPHTLKDAKEKFAKGRFHLVILGINFPGAEKHLHELLETAKKDRLSVLATTLSNDKNEIQRYLEAGFDGVLTKPYYEQDLLTLINLHMKDQLQEDEQKSPVPVPPPTTFNVEQLKKIGNNDEEFVIRMLEKFLQSATECSENLMAALPESNWARIKTAAHKNIPSYSLMGAGEMVKDLEFIETNAEVSTYTKEVADRVRLIEARNREIIREVTAYIAYLKQKRKN